jgi:putative heme-binding domain-containing protein
MSVKCLPWLLILVVLKFCFQRSAQAQAPALDQLLLAQPRGDLAADAREKGDAARGALLFYSPGLGCIKCHDGSATGLGPNLSAWDRPVDDAHLVESVLQPSAKIEPKYRSLIVLTSDGRTLLGVEKRRDEDSLTLQVGVQEADTMVIPLNDVEQERAADVSIMPAGQVNVLRLQQDFLDLIAYLIAIRDGGAASADKLRPSEEALKLKIPEYETKLDHRGLIAAWDEDALERGEKIYAGLCVNCHGTVQEPGSLPTSLRFASGKFKFGKDPFSMYQTLTHGGGMMVPQSWMVPQQKYDVIHYVREHFLRQHNPSEYASITDVYLASLPKGDSRGPEPVVIEPWAIMDYGPMLTTTIEFGEDAANIAQKAIAIQVDDRPGGIARGNAWVAFEHDTLRVAGAWTGQFVDWNGIQFNGRHGVHLRANGQILLSNPTGPGWANPQTGSFEDGERVVGRDDRRYGPLPSNWGKFRGLHRYENQVVLRYTVGETEVLERSSLLEHNSTQLFARTVNVGQRNRELKMLVATVGDEASLTRQDAETVLVKTTQGLLTFKLAGFGAAVKLDLEGSRVVLKFASGENPVNGSVLFASGTVDVPPATIRHHLDRLGTDLEKLTSGGPAQMATPVEVPAKIWFESEAWAVDELVRPEINPWLARTRVTGLDFYEQDDQTSAYFSRWGFWWLVIACW